ncbi:MAG TPA: hypothetical protein VM348_11600 [Brevundimonas sp.]|nr:hypothetical protein [Brevundimonas sp.]
MSAELFEQFPDDLGETGQVVVIEGDGETVYAYLFSAAHRIIAFRQLYDPKRGPPVLDQQNYDALRHSVAWVREPDGLKAHVSVNGHLLASFSVEGVSGQKNH